MRSVTFTTTLLAMVPLALGATPRGFQPSTDADLVVAFRRATANNGAALARNSTQSKPRLATKERLEGTYAVVMIDLDIPTDSPPETNTLLHWMQTGLTCAQQPTTIGGTRAFLLENKTNSTALAPYFGPNPPAREPLSHRYTFVLVDHSDITTQGLAALQSAAGTRLGFNAQKALTAAGLNNKVVAGNFFNVTNGDNNTGRGGNNGNGTSGGGIGGNRGGNGTEIGGGNGKGNRNGNGTSSDGGNGGGRDRGGSASGDNTGSNGSGSGGEASPTGAQSASPAASSALVAAAPGVSSLLQTPLIALGMVGFVFLAL